MKTPLNLLIIDDSEDDAQMLTHALERGDYDLHLRRVDTASAVQEALDNEVWDLVLADYEMSGMGVQEILAMVRERDLDIPLLLVSRAIAEDTAVEAVKAGVSDYIMKDNLQRLVPAVERELRETQARRERRRVAEALRESEEKYRLHFDSLNDVIYSFDTNLFLTNVSPSVKAQLDYDAADLVGRPFSDLGILEPESLPPARADLEKVLSGEMVSSARYAFVTRTGEHRFCEVSMTPLMKDGVVIAAIAVARDISERLHLEEQLRQSQKMEAVGRLAGGVAHDFNNILTAISGYADLLGHSLEAHDPLRRQVDEIKSALERAAELTHQLLAFSRKQLLQLRVLNLNVVVADMEKMLRRLIGEDIELVNIPGADLGSVKADPGQLEQVILNLAVNARDAMAQGGKLTIQTANVDLGPEYVQKHVDVPPGPYVMLAVADNGTGMEEETLSRIFEPFFSAKEGEKGTGLGLSTVYGIVKQSGGHVEAESEPWGGTTLKVYLPRVHEPAEARAPEASPLSTLRGSETVLLVEDEASVRTVILEILQRHGYKVLEAPNPGEAILISEQHTGLIHLLLTDVVMPRMSAPELAERLAPWHPEMKVLFMSGYTDSSIVRDGVIESGAPFIQKPFAPEDLLQAVRQVLDATRGGVRAAGA